MTELTDNWSFPAVFEKALQDGADPNAPDDAGNLPLPRAVTDKKARYVELLLKAGADVNGVPARDGGAPALACAIAVKDWKIGMLLVDAGADPTIPSRGPMAVPCATPLNWAYANDNKLARKIRERAEAAGQTFGSAQQPFILPFALEKAMGKLTGGYDRSFPYLWVEKVRDLQAELVRLGGTITTADALASLGSVHVLPRLVASAFSPGTRFRVASGSRAAAWVEDRTIEILEAYPTVTKLDRDRHAKSLAAPLTPIARIASNIEIVVHGKNTGEMVRGWDCEEPSDDITFGMGDDLEFLRSLEPVGG